MSALLGVAIVVSLSPLSRAAVIDPQFAKNITIYHVNEKSEPASPVNMNTADINGDMYFALRTVGLPLECGPWVNQSFWPALDCSNPEVANTSNLAVTKLVLEVDTRFDDYADCNIDPVSGQYQCSCEDVQDDCTRFADSVACDGTNTCNWNNNRCEEYGCSNATSKSDCVDNYGSCKWDSNSKQCTVAPGPKAVCDRSRVGFLNLSNVDWGDCYDGASKIDCWHGNTLRKTNGFWYSTWAEGECRPNDPTQKSCSWSLTGQDQKIGKSCSDGVINAAIAEGDRNASWGARCFDKCSTNDQKNASSQCWIECFYANVLGPLGNSQAMNHSSPNFGIPLSELQAAWEKPFLPVAQGGCPALLPSAPQAFVV